MPKILGQAGISLADVYDVEGSIAGTEELLSQDVGLAHEMGGQILSERLGSFVVILDTGAIAQSLNFEVIFNGLPDCVNRILGCKVVVNNAARVNEANVTISVPGSLEYPIFVWDDAQDVEREIRMQTGGTVGGKFELSSALPFVPTLALRAESEKTMPSLILRGTTIAFGAGTVITQALLYLCRGNTETPTPGEPSSHGLPLPSW